MNEGRALHPSILRAYDIRGVVGETLADADMAAIGRSFATILGHCAASGRRPLVCVGRDGRTSSPALEESLAQGLASGGADVLRIGLGPTPMLYFSSHRFESDGAMMVTGSHNPPDHNGVKLMLGRSPFFGADIAALGRVAEEGGPAERAGSVREAAVAGDYVRRLLDEVPSGAGWDLKVAWDAGNGAAGAVLPALAERLPGRHILLNATVDGTFPAHHPDPSVAANLAQLSEAVRKERCDLGIAFDGDGDRIGAVDGEGALLRGDEILALAAREVLRERPGATVIADVKTSRTLFEEVARLGGAPLMWKTGHAPIKAKMAETGALLAGEVSGHLFFADRYFGYDDALYAALRLLRLVAEEGRSLAALRAELPRRFTTPEIRFPCPDTRRFAVAGEIRARLEAAGVPFNAVDGIRAEAPDGWWLLRASNTQSALVARCEGEDEAALARVKRDLAAQLRASGIVPPSF